MEIDGHDEITGGEIDWACDTRDEPTQEDIVGVNSKYELGEI